MDSFKLLDTKISLTTNDMTFNIVRNYNFESPGYICVIGLIEVLEGHINPLYRKAFNDSFLNPLHARSIEFIAKRKGFRGMKTLDPVWLLEKLLNEDVSHYFYGSSDAVLLKIKNKIAKNYPSARILDYKSPPFVGMDEIKGNEIIKSDFDIINKLKPDIIWIGLGGVKQDVLMYYHKQNLQQGLMIGVGAVYDCFIGNIKLRPDWMKRMGISWLFYLVQQPKFRTMKLIRLFKGLMVQFVKNRVRKISSYKVKG